MSIEVSRQFPARSLLFAALVAALAGRGLAAELVSNLTIESHVPLSEIPCHVMAEKPDLGFDLRFHGAYEVSIPLKVLADLESPLTVNMTVTPTGAEQPSNFVRWFYIPEIPSRTGGDVLLGDGLELGTGHFHVSWRMRDSRGRACSSQWEWEAKLGRRQHDFPLTLYEGAVADRTGTNLGRALSEIPVTHPRRIKVLLNLSPTKPSHSILKPEDASVLFSILRGLAEEPGVSYSGLLAFNLREQRIVYRNNDGNGIDLASLRQALHGPSAGTVSYRVLQNPSGETEFVTKLLIDELGAGAVAPDAVLIIGPKVSLDVKVPVEFLRRSGAVSCPIFYFNYNPIPIDEPFGDTIGSALRAYKAAMSYNIVFPKDLGAAVRDVLSRLGAPYH
jgi:hypothetical protein